VIRLFTLAPSDARFRRQLLRDLNNPDARVPVFGRVRGKVRRMATGDEKRAAIVAQQAAREQAERLAKGPASPSAHRPRKPRTNWAATRPIHGNPRGRSKPEGSPEG
jgi:hypothetical protein